MKILALIGIIAAFIHASPASTVSATLLSIDGLTVAGTLAGQTNTYQSGILVFDKFDAFCIDPWQPLTAGSTVFYTESSPTVPLEDAELIARLVSAYLSSPMTQEDASAVQWAIWKTVASDTQPPPLAQAYLTNAWQYEPANVTYWTNSELQDIITWSVPEPSTSMLAALSVVMFRRNRTK